MRYNRHLKAEQSRIEDAIDRQTVIREKANLELEYLAKRLEVIRDEITVSKIQDDAHEVYTKPVLQTTRMEIL